MSNSIERMKRITDAFKNIQGEVDSSLTFTGWRENLCRLHAAFELLRQEDEKEIAEISETYSPNYAAPKIQEIRKASEQVRAVMIDAQQAEIDKIVAAKREQLSKSMDAPSEQQVRLLQTYALRDSVSPSELTFLAEKCANNLPALAATADLAKRNGITFPVISVETVEEDIQKAADFASERLQALGKHGDALAYKEKLFFNSDAPGEAASIFGAVDGSPFTASIKEALPQYDESKAAQSAPVKQRGRRVYPDADPVTQPALSRVYDLKDQSGDNCTRVTLRPGQGIIDIVRGFCVSRDDIATMNAGVDLGKLHGGMTVDVPTTILHVLDGETAIRPEQTLTFAEPLD